MKVPEAVRRAVADELGELDPPDREMFELRLARWWDDLVDGLGGVYGSSIVGDAAHRLAVLAASAFAGRDPDLRRLDLQRLLDPGWFQRSRMLGYAAYADRFAGDLRGVAGRADYLEELGVTYLHLMPLLQPRPGANDGGYAVADYRTVRPDLGTIEDLRDLATELRRRGISLCLDLVLNHVAREHEWAAAARRGDQRYQAYFRIFPDRSLPDAHERTLPEIFPDFAPGSFTRDDEVDGWVWTTFNEWQWDLDWSNPDVLHELAAVILFLANLGVDVLRLDAIAFIWKRLGTTSQNQPEVHGLTQALRAVTRMAAPAVLFKAEAIVAPADLVHYLGRGRHHGKVSDLAYHNSLMVHIWSMLATHDVRLSVHALRAIDEVPATAAWVTYVRCHDDIGWAVDDVDAAAVGLTGFAHRAFLSDYYSGDFWQSPARGMVFQHNEATGDRRISGSLASLAGLDAALESGDPDELDQAIARIVLTQTIMLGWGGIPVLWMGDELGLRNDPAWADDPAHADDNRWAHRPRMPWDVAARRHEPGSVEQRVFETLVARARVRAGLVHLDAAVRSEPLDPTDPGVFAVLRRHPVGPFVGLYNVTDTDRPFPTWRLDELGLPSTAMVDALNGAPPPIDIHGNVRVPPYGAYWLVAG